MPRLTLLFVVLTIADITVNLVLARNLVKNGLGKFKLQQQLKDKYLESGDDGEDDSVNSLNAQELESLVEVVLNTGKYDTQKPQGRKEKNKNKNLKLPVTLFDQLTGLGENDVLVYNPDHHQSTHIERQKDPLWDVLGSSSYDRDVNDEVNDNLVKPVYLILESEDSQRSKGDRYINDITSSLFELLSANQYGHNDGRQNHRYKGFRLKESLRRAKDSSDTSSYEIEEKHPPITRPRAYGGGRTPIPYIKHRGDIYERDN